MTTKWPDQSLGDVALPGTIDELLTALHDHVLGEFIIEVVPGREMPLLRAKGGLVEASRDRS
jgi:hypothetical protein